MAATALTRTVFPLSTSVAGIAVTMTACDAVNGNSIVSSGTEVCIIVNSDSSAHTFAITGVNDPSLRLANFSASVPGSPNLAGVSVWVTPRLSQAFWSAANSIILPSSNNALLLVGVLTGV